MPEEKKTPDAIVAGGLTQKQIDQLKKEHGSLMLITLKGNDGDEHFWFKKPDMDTMSAYMKIVQADPLKAGQLIFNSCIIKGRKKAVDEVETFLSLMKDLSTIAEKMDTEVKKF